MKKEVVINGKRYWLRYTLRGLFIYEEITGKPFDGVKLVDNYLLLYSMLLACNPDDRLTFDEVVDACDEEDSVFAAFNEVLVDRMNRNAELAGDKKKVSQ